MYLKSMELHGFKSFANKIVLEFHNGITGIVGPNGSGKSNVSDAVRWVLGEQSARSLRGAAMTDVIFSGTENRKPLSYAYVSITLDNSDHVLPVEYNEVTIARRVYRSGESEYLMNGVQCRLKDVNELFYDTGIGKEGYSIIGQGQIERILSGKPEERRELFDEAVGIVKYKKRKAAAIKKLHEEEDDLERIRDILGELERQVGPLEKQAETAREFLKKRDALKRLDVNMYLLDMSRLEEENTENEKKYRIAKDQLTAVYAQNETIKKQFAALEEKLKQADGVIEQLRNEMSETDLKKEKLEGQIRLLEEQIRFADESEHSLAQRKQNLEDVKAEHEKQKLDYEKKKQEVEGQLRAIREQLVEAKKSYGQVEETIAGANATIEKDNRLLHQLLNEKADLKSGQQRNKTLREQTTIRRSQLTQRILSRKTREEELARIFETAHEQYLEITEKVKTLKASLEEMQQKDFEWRSKRQEAKDQLSGIREELTKKRARLDSLKNIAERYEGYGHAIRKVMEQKDEIHGIHGVVADLIHVEKRYEVAIETALGGNIQNIVTEDEACAKELIRFLKKGRHGRATFLPLTAVKKREEFPHPKALKEPGIIGLADELVSHDKIYDGILSSLLGRVIVADTIDHALALAKNYHYTLHIVTLEGEYLRPGGGLTGGSFKNNSNLLGRGRELDVLKEEIAQLEEQQEECKKRLDEVETARTLLAEDKKEVEHSLSEARLEENTAGLTLRRSKEQVEESKKAFGSLEEESHNIEAQLQEIDEGEKKAAEDLSQLDEKEKQLNQEIADNQRILAEISDVVNQNRENVSKIQVQEASIEASVKNVEENLERIVLEIAKDQENIASLDQENLDNQKGSDEKKAQIQEIKKTIEAAGKSHDELKTSYQKALEQKEEWNTSHKGFFDQKEKIAADITGLEKEIYRLESLREKNESSSMGLNSYMWEQYELTLHAAKELRDESLSDASALRKEIKELKNSIRMMGDVNVHAVEEYAEVSQRYTFLKTQHDDLMDTKEKLITVIEELDTGMREQFTAGFADIQREFDAVFKQLFGGGHGKLELMEGEDLLESGIRIIAQPPGKRLQNMMQLSGGEKSLTAIALLFAIQNLKPSPFCLLDEIEAALDDSNVDRFAGYLHKLTKNTQFIVITHRRGTMNSADRLYGITMQEKGISTLVSVNLIEDKLDA
ncbi:MAG: chromosome segregation protein SMC [Lachnospiraceae bacterium]|nr:chromosome segregation protein SMC [Lachnospiraceae bacterium]